MAEQYDFLRDADDINLSRRTKVVEIAKAALGGSLDGRKVAVLGAAFKPDSDDIRDSPALSIAGALHEHGAQVTVHDPEALPGVRTRYPHLATAESVNEAVANADIVLHLTEWQEYRAIDPQALRPLVNSPIIIDGRNVLDLDTWINAGWSITYLGKPGS